MTRILWIYIASFTALLWGGATNSSAQEGSESPAPSPVQAEGDEAIVLNFEGADIREVINSLATALGINYSIDPRVQGQVTIRTTGKIARRDLFPIFHEILRSNGIAATKIGDIYQIAPVGEAKTRTPLTGGAERRTARSEGRFVVELVKVEHVGAEEIAKVLQQFVTPGGDVLAYPRGNLVILTDLAESVDRLKELIAAFDTDMFHALRSQVYHIENANVEDLGGELKDILEPYGLTPKNAEERGVFIVPLTRLNAIVVIGFNPEVFAQVERWLQILDVPPEKGGGRTVHVYPVENAKALDLANVLNGLYGGEGGGGGGGIGGGRSRSSSGGRGGASGGGIGGAGGGGNAMGGAGTSLGGGTGQGGLSSRGNSLSGSGTGGSSGGGGLGGSRTGSLGGSRTGSRSGGGIGAFGGEGGGGGSQTILIAPKEGEKPIFKEEVRIVADDISNSLIILATARDFEMIKEVLRRLDIVPRQVLIETLIAEIGLTDNLQFGVEYAIANQGIGSVISSSSNSSSSTSTTTGGTTTTTTGGTTTTTGGTTTTTTGGSGFGTSGDILIDNNALLQSAKRALKVGATGLSGFITDRDTFLVLLRALASRSQLRSLATPHVIAADNREAHILIGEEIPILTSTSTSLLTATAQNYNSIQYRDTGKILTIVPQVNSAGLVNMEIRQEVSAVGQSSFGNTNSPSFTSREAETTVVVQSGESVLIGGIIDDQLLRARSGVPFLMDIPVLGRLFRVDTERIDRTELIILITPHVIRDREEAHSITEEFENRIHSLKGMIERIKPTKPQSAPAPASIR